MQLVPVFLAILAGIAATVQASLNSGLARSTGLAPALIVNTVVVLAGTICFWWLTDGRPVFHAPGVHWVYYLGGLGGFIVIGSLAFGFPRLGAGWTIALMVFGQTIAALTIDHFGCFGMAPIEISLKRVLGLLIVVVGVAVFRL
jgi:transporter family-2 protein